MFGTEGRRPETQASAVIHDTRRRVLLDLAASGVVTAAMLFAVTLIFPGKPSTRLMPEREPFRVTVTSNVATLAGCTAVGDIYLSGAVGRDNNLRNESERDSYVKSIAADDGANVVLVLEKTSSLVRGRGYRCPENP